MFDKLKQQPLIGLALAIAAGYVIAHFAIKVGDILYENDPDNFWTLLAALALLSAATWQRRAIAAWIKSHKRALAWTGAVVLCMVSGLAWHAAIVDARERKQGPVTFDPKSSMPIFPAPAATVQQQEDPVQHAKLLRLQKQLGLDAEGKPTKHEDAPATKNGDAPSR